MSEEEKTLLILEPNTLDLQKLMRYKELEARGIQEPELTRAVEAEFVDYPTDSNPIPWPGPITGIDNAGNNNPELIFATATPPLVLPQENFPGPYDVSNVNPYPNNPTPDENSVGGTSSTYDFTNFPYPGDNTNWLGTSNKIDSQPPTSGIEGFNSEKAIPEWRYNVEDSQVYPDVTPDIILPPSGALNEAITQDKKKQKKSLLQRIFPWLAIIGGAAAAGQLIDDYMNKAPEEPEERNEYFTHTLPTIHAMFTLSSSHTGKDVCDDFAGEIFDLTDKTNRPILPTEGLGYSNLTHPNCQCKWVLQKVDTLTDSLTRKQQTNFDDIASHIRKGAKDHTLHTVKPDGTLSKRTRGTNPMQEAIGKIREQFNWLGDEYITNAKELAEQNNGTLYLIRAAQATITDHRAEGEQYRRKLSGQELQGMARTAIKNGMDVNHDPAFKTQATILDADYDVKRKEIQMVVMEKDPQINQYIRNGVITAVSINGGNPRRQVLEPCDDNCTSNNCEICNVPQGVILGEDDGIGMTWVVTDPRGIIYKGQHLEPAEPGIKQTVIEPL